MLRICIAVLMLAATVAQADRLIVPPATIVAAANKLAYRDFPKALDILAIIRVESSFRADAVNREESKRRPHRRLPPSRGLMQVQNGSLNATVNMRQGVALLRQYYITLGRSRQAAVKSYNIGIGAYQRGQAKVSAEIYWQKFSRRRSEYVRYYSRGRL